MHLHSCGEAHDWSSKKTVRQDQGVLVAPTLDWDNRGIELGWQGWVVSQGVE